MTETEWVTIAEAARRLGLAERQARRWADRLPADARRQEETTPGRSRALIQLAALKHLFEADSDRTGDRTHDRTGDRTHDRTGDRTHDRTGDRTHDRTAKVLPPDAGTEPTPDEIRDAAAAYPVPLALAMTAQRDALERVISEQAAHIADLQAALDHERGQSKQLADALAREQTLRMLENSSLERPPEMPATEGLKMPVEAPDSPQGADRNGADGLKPRTEPILAQIAAFWKRHWY